MRLPQKVVIYSDINRKIVLSSADSVQNYSSLDQKIFYVIGTPRKTRKWRPRFGSDVLRYLFEPFDETTADWIRTYTRVSLEDPANGLTEDITNINVNVQLSTDQTYIVTISYYAPKLQQVNETSFVLHPQ